MDRLAFRDARRAHPTLVQDYQALKQALAQAHRHDREAYTATKGSSIARALQAARQGRAG